MSATQSYAATSSTAGEKSDRIRELVELNQPDHADRARIRAIMNGGTEAVAALLGDRMSEQHQSLPVANHVLSANTALAQKLGRIPDVKVDPPDDADSQRAHTHAEKRARTIEHLDDLCDLNMMMPQLGRWISGYGFTAIVIAPRKDDNGSVYPNLELRDPYETYPGIWTSDQQPADMACERVVAPNWIKKHYPEHEAAINEEMGNSSFGQVVDLSRTNTAQSTWASQNSRGISVYEYYDHTGTYWILPRTNRVLEHIPNRGSEAPFHIFKRFSFDKLTGQYDHVIGLMSAIARLNILMVIAAEDNVNAETNIIGDIVGDYERGRFATNFFTPGTSVQKQQDRIPTDVFQQGNKLEEQLRQVAGYPVMDDSVSPNSFVTGRGLEQLNTAVNQEVKEYFTVLRNGLKALDRKRLQWLENEYSSRSYQIYGTRDGSPFNETIEPSKHIKGAYRTRRVYGAMAAFDEPSKVVTGLQLLQGNIIDEDTMREQIEGLENHTKIKERIRGNRAEQVLFEGLSARAQQGDVEALESVVDLLPEGDFKSTLENVLVPSEEERQRQQQAAQQQAQAGPQQQNPLQQLAQQQQGSPPPAAEVLTRLTQSGQPRGGVQTQGPLNPRQAQG